MLYIPLHCPFCGTDDVSKNGHSNGKQRYACHNADCSHQTFYAEYTYNACKPEVKTGILHGRLMEQVFGRSRGGSKSVPIPSSPNKKKKPS